MRVTLNITANDAWKVVDYLDSKKFFCLDEKTTSRTDLILFAAAMGFNRGYPKDVNQSRRSIVRTEYFHQEKHVFSALYYYHKIMTGEETIDKLTDENAPLELVEQYAETGFEVIKEHYQSDNEENFCLDLINQMDQWYEDYFEQPK